MATIGLAVSNYRRAVIATHAAHIAWQAGIIPMSSYNAAESAEWSARVDLITESENAK